MKNTLRIGVIGVSSARGWAGVSHVPAIKGVAGLEFAGVTGKTQDGADKTATEFGATRGYSSVESMMADPAIDVVTIAVRVPSHRELILKALAAGKHVYCEWPLGRDVQESEELQRAAEEAGVHVAIGLQSRKNPTLLRAQKLLQDGAIGRVLSARMYSGTIAFGTAEGEADSYLEDATNGATHLTIHGGHAADAAIALLGPLANATALNTVQYKHINIDEGARMLERTIADHLFFLFETEAGAPVSVEVDGGRPKDDTRFRFEITGESGTLVLEGGAAVGFQAGRLTLAVNGQSEAIDQGELATLPDTAANVGALYAALRDDIANGTRTTPDFAHAVRLTKLLADIDESSKEGRRTSQSGWPVS